MNYRVNEIIMAILTVDDRTETVSQPENDLCEPEIQPKFPENCQISRY